jgi:cap2 methyltransferase
MSVDWCALEANPHCQQAEHPVSDIPFSRILTPDARSKPYRRRTDESKTVVHWGQRKLLMSEIEFLLMTQTDKKICTVVYAGAAPGTHVQLLADMFPSHRFILVDPAPFTVRPKKGRIVIHQTMFTDELAEELHRSLRQKTRVLFISDVRSSDSDFHSEQIHNERIRSDMCAQARWHSILRPFKSMLKFRLPYAPGRTKYLKGDLYLPIWGPVTTTECRLVVNTCPGMRTYDHVEHEAKMFHFNTVTRVAMYPHSITCCGMDHCYDCVAEVQILQAFSADIPVARLSDFISRWLSSERTLKDKNPEYSQKTSVIRRRQWKEGVPSYEKYF